jgi:hypothetical protein
MTEPRLSLATEALLRAAKSDAPSAAARAKVWSTVAGTVGGAAGAGAVGAAGSVASGSGAIATGGVTAAKMLAAGTLLGGAVTVGLAAMMLRIGTVPSQPLPAATTPVAAFEARDPVCAPLVSPDPPRAAAPRPGLASQLSATNTRPSAPSTAARQPMAADALAREASLVMQARAALVGGDAPAALRAIHAARMLPSHELAPEELSVEAQALRKLGKDDQAKDVDSALRKQFPESALAR